ncbi:iron-siderophore ABC transporter substrate-binding protein [Corynebacterium diphtheriae]|uniref:Iron-siderophore ABC transporter substrate-binding protein n=1 Tax=Corynebacterium diphtheriae TaxID=1717 RepID=A0A811G488_CORDP|nr:iron-siderophore ABC transporter substrate-binding protein [Corynebacterium diphtheriae]OWN38005.1 ABC transporter substrate-binding protein [Corynebacterium belfantii]AEX73021.1 ABC-type Fe3+-hydroxamate transport system, periplasmic component [Corynebacterium diphtheriae CDCE 8392]APM36211.1 ABC transporter substrate-binding protein [Corynebacterium diphtheriae]MBG9276473.1 iron-siderophore ABC transporter substrate-binding protein [Corynebacterium diphtheriae bv. mitis]MBG9280753.1 iron-
MNKTFKTLTLALATGSIALTLAACGNTDSATEKNANSVSASDSNAQFPITIKHAFGETTIKDAPQRIASVGWANHEVPLALGQVPVGMSKATFGDDNDNGILPWVEDKLKELGADSGDKKPVLFDETDGIPFEQVADTKPDIILATYSGISQEDYDTLSKIAPVIAYPDMAWGTSLEDMITISAKALGKAEEGKKLTEDLDTKIADNLDKYPNLKGKKALFTSFGGSSDPSKIGFYSVKDPRMGFLVSHGLTAPKIVEEQSKTAEKFWVEVSTEKPEEFDDVDVIISYSSGNKAEDDKKVKDMQADPLLSKIPAVKNGNIAFLENGPLGAAANPSPLSIPWAIDRYFATLNDGLK